MPDNDEFDLPLAQATEAEMLTTLPRIDKRTERVRFQQIRIPESQQIRFVVPERSGFEGQCDIGDLSCLPQEILHMVAMQMDVKTLVLFSRSCRIGRVLVGSLSGIKLIEQFQEALTALRMTGFLDQIPVSKLLYMAKTDQCSCCMTKTSTALSNGAEISRSYLGSYLFIPAGERACLHCLRYCPRFRMITTDTARQLLDLPEQQLAGLAGRFQPLPIRYYRKRGCKRPSWRHLSPAESRRPMLPIAPTSPYHPYELVRIGDAVDLAQKTHGSACRVMKLASARHAKLKQEEESWPRAVIAVPSAPTPSPLLDDALSVLANLVEKPPFIDPPCVAEQSGLEDESVRLAPFEGKAAVLLPVPRASPGGSLLTNDVCACRGCFVVWENRQERPDMPSWQQLIQQMSGMAPANFFGGMWNRCLLFQEFRPIDFMQHAVTCPAMQHYCQATSAMGELERLRIWLSNRQDDDSSREDGHETSASGIPQESFSTV